jgi:putative nucleotidyltransferase with HDIG domain
MAQLQAVLQAASDSVGGLDRHDVVARLQRTFASPSYQPPMLPEVALEVMQLSQRPDVKFEEVVHLLQKDAVLAARVLSIAQSSAYAARSPIQTLHQASVRLGLKAMRDIVLEAAFHMKVFRVPGYEGAMERLARHSAAVAHVMRAVCRRSNVEAEYAFLCGLLHDVGFAASLLALCDDPTWRKASFEELAPVLDEVHEEASGLLARLWKLPENIQRMVATHHEPAPDGKVQLVNATLIVAEQLCWEAGAGLEPPPPDADAYSMETPEPPSDGVDVNWSGLVDEARKLLRMDDLSLAAARAEAFSIVEALSGGSGGAPSAAPPRRTARA